MDIHFNRLMSYSAQAAQTFGERIIQSQTGQQKKILVISLIALGCLAAYLYYAMKGNNQAAKITGKNAQQKIADDQKPNPMSKSEKAFDKALKKDGVLTEDDEIDPQDDKKAAKKPAVQPVKKDQAKSNDPQPKKAASKSRLIEDADLEEAILRSMADDVKADLDPKSTKKAPNLNPKDTDLEAALRQSEEHLEKDDAEILKAAIRESKKEASGTDEEEFEVVDDEEEFERIRLQLEKEAIEKEEAEYEEALKLSKGGTAKLPGKPAPRKPVNQTPVPKTQTPGPTKPVAKTPNSTPKPDPVKDAPKKPDPVKDTPKPDPVKDTPKPDPIKDAPKQGPVNDTPQPDLVNDTPKADPIKDAPKQDPVNDTPKPDPVKDTPKADPVKDTPKKGDKTAVDKELLETTKPNSDNSDVALEKAVERAKEKLESAKVKIVGHQIRRNEGNNAFLVLDFENAVQRNIAVHELKTNYTMFQTSEPVRKGQTVLQLSVEETLDFQTRF